MGIKFTFPAALGAILLLGTPALAWSDRPMTQPASPEAAVWAYPTSANYCPAGLQPVTIGGVICCGKPTHVGYATHPTPRRHYKPRASYNTGYVAYGKGYNDDGTGD